MKDLLLEQSFYRRSAMELAPALLGQLLVVGQGDGRVVARIVETEAYCGLDDKGNHAYNGRRSPKNESMYLGPGHAYVYKCYGVHDMFNVVSGVEGHGEAVLIRAVEPVEGIDLMMASRSIHSRDYRLTGGPGKVCAAMGIRKEHDKLELFDFQSPVRILTGGFEEEVYTGPRVGMSKYVGECANWSRRFYLKGNKYVSRPLHVWYNF
ncbi:MAG: DNA-3-methyladenine glycosylase [Saprospiraceae bacterium]|nr:DNA-3-methyladenine glycosylase [Saprospiraceae bacterium]